MSRFAAGNFIDLVDENDAHLFGALDSSASDLIHIEKLVFFFLDQVFERIGHGHFAFLFLLAEHSGEDVFNIDVHFFNTLIGNNFEGRHGALADFNVYHTLVVFAFAELHAQFFAGAVGLFALCGNVRFTGSRCRCRRRWKQQVEDALLGGLFRAVGDFVELFLANHIDGCLHQIANHGFHIATNVANLGVLGGFHLDEGTTRETGQAARNFRFAYTGWADHQNIFRQNIFSDFRRQLLPANTVAQRHGHSTLCSARSDDVLVEFDDNFAQ